MASLREFFTIRRVIGLVIVPAASVAIDHFWGLGWLTAALLTAYLTVILAMAIEHHFIPRPYLSLRKLHNEAGKKIKRSPMLARYYENSTRHTEQALRDIVNDRFEFDIESVPTLSIDAMNLVDKDCLLTFPLRQSEALLIHKTGPAHQYDEAIKSASARIKGMGGEGVTRVFILARRDDVSESLINFMQRNVDDGIIVRVLFEEDAPPPPPTIEALDFGYYETTDQGSWVIILRQSTKDPSLTRYIVDTRESRVKSYLAYGLELVELSMSFGDFMGMVTMPVNRDLWPLYFAKNGYEMAPPHGLSDEDADYIVKAALATVGSPKDATVIVLGFTPKLLKRLVECDVGRVVSIDQSSMKPSYYQDRVEYVTGTWTQLPESYGADAIVFDESVNNMSKVQLGMFFSSTARALKPGGFLVGRVMGRFEPRQADRFGGLSEGRVIEHLRSVDGAVHSDFAPLIICLLHARSMGFDETLSVANCEIWNKVLRRLHDEHVIKNVEHEHWHLEFDFRLLSPKQEALLRGAASAGFGLSELRDVSGTYAQKCADTADFYKILRFALPS